MPSIRFTACGMTVSDYWFLHIYLLCTHTDTPMATKKTAPARPAAKAVAAPAQAPLNETRLAALLALVAFAVYANTLGHGFVLDDVAVITQNRFVQQGIGGIPEILSTYYWKGYWDSNAGLYRPLSLVMFAVEHSLMPGSPFLHHLVQVLLYALCVYLLFGVLRRVLRGYTVWLPFAVILLFAVHPIHTEVVANIKSRDEILCFLFFLLTFRVLLTRDMTHWKNKLAAAGLFLLCLLSKEAGLLYLPILAVYYRLVEPKPWRNLAAMLAPLAITATLWLAWHRYIIHGSPDPLITYTFHDNPLLACPDAASRVATGIGLLGRYLLKTVWPWPLSYDYSFNQLPCLGWTSPGVWLTLIATAGLLYAAWRYRRSHPVVSFGVFYFFIGMALASNIVTLIGTGFGERLLFSPVLGILLLLVYAAYAGAKQLQVQTARHGILVAVCLLALPAALVSVGRNTVWKSDQTLFLHDAETATQSARAQYNKGVVLMEALPADLGLQQPKLPAVVNAFEEALRLDPLEKNAHVNLAVCLYRLKRYPESIAHSQAALALDTADHVLYGNLADAYLMNGQADSAIAYYNRAIASGAVTENTYSFLGAAWFSKKQYKTAAEVFGQGLARSPNNTEMWMNRGNALALDGQLSQAEQAFQQVLRLSPGNRKAYYYLSMVYRDMGKAGESQRYLSLYNGQ